MRQVNIQEVGMENFGPYLDPMILEFKNDSIVLITGPNGIGKTMALDAISYTFYGSTSKGAKGDDVVNNTVGRNCKTWVKFKINDDQYLITRYQKYTKVNNTVILNKNGVDTRSGHKEVLPEIEKLICSKGAFMNTLMFGQKVKNFFTDLVDSDKKVIFRELLGLEQYQLYYKETSDVRLKQVKESIDENQKSQGINEGLRVDTHTQIQILLDMKKRFEEEKQNVITELKTSIDSNKRLLKEWQEELVTLEKEDIDINETVTDLANIESELNTIQATLENEIQSIEQRKTTKLLDLQNKANNTSNEINAKYRKEYDRITNELTELRETLNDLVTTAQSRKHKVELKVENVESDIRNWQDRAHEIEENVIKAEISECPLCEQKVSEETTDLLSKKVVKYNSDISEGFKLASSLQEQIKEMNTEMIKGSDQLNSFIDKLKEENNQFLKQGSIEIQQVDERLIIATEKVNKLAYDEQMQKGIAIQKAKNDINSTKLVLLSKKKDQEYFIEKMGDIKKTINDINHDISRRELQIQEKEKEEYDEIQLNSYKKRQLTLDIELQNLETEWAVLDRKQMILDFWKTAFSSSGIPSMLIDEAIPFMNEKVADYLDKLTNGRYIVSFDTLASIKSGEFRDKISVNVVDTYTRANSRIQLSGGQTRIIDIATILTLGDLQASIQDVSINILLFDEIFDSLDEENIGYVSKVLSKLKVGKSIYLISHRHEDQLEADEVLTLH